MTDRSPSTLLLSALTLAVGLTACQQQDPAATPATDAGAVAADATPNPTARQVDPPAAAEPVAMPSAIASQPGPKGSRVDLTKVAVTGNLLTVQLAYHAAADSGVYAGFPIDQVSVIDDATSQRYSVVKDASGRYMALPASSNGENFQLGISSGDSGQVSFKFPAPPVTSTTVSITLPEVGPFDGIPVQR